jgi:hypothetical protein
MILVGDRATIIHFDVDQVRVDTIDSRAVSFKEHG